MMLHSLRPDPRRRTVRLFTYVIALVLMGVLPVIAGENGSDTPSPPVDRGPDRAGPDRSEPGSGGTGQPESGPAASPPSGQPMAIPAYRQANRVAVLSVHGVIDQVTLRSLERRVEQATNDGADAIVLDINTPGGDLMATLDICHLLKTDAPANTVAWINPEAYSAGTIIALAAREIIVGENARFGDAAPVHGLGVPIPVAERAKIEAPVLDEVSDSARRHHYDENLVQSFISVGVELWLIEHRQTGERMFVNRREFEVLFGEEPSDTARTGPGDVSEQELTRLGKRLKPFMEYMVGSADEEPQDGLTRPRTDVRPEITRSDRGNYRLIRQVISNERLLVVRAEDAIEYGLAQAKVRNESELLAYFGAQDVVYYDENWSEELARFLMSFPVRIFLIVVFLVGFFVEIAAPGTGLFGLAALVALLLLFGAPMLMGMAAWWGLLLVVIGIALVMVELLLLPGVGVVGIAGLLSLLCGMVGVFVTGGLDTAQGQQQMLLGLVAVLTAFFGAGIIIWLFARQMKSIPLLNHLVLRTELSTPDALKAHADAPEHGQREQSATRAAAADSAERSDDQDASDPEDQQPADESDDGEIRVGQIGRTRTDLRPHGRADFGGRLFEVQSIDGFIEEGTQVRVTAVGRFVIEVEVASE